MIVAGIGCRPGVAADAVVALVRRAAGAGLSVDLLAVPVFRADEAGLVAAAARMGIGMRIMDHAALDARQADCVTLSAVARARVGLASVAEACALAGAGAGSVLLVARLAEGGVTCAVARAEGAS